KKYCATSGDKPSELCEKAGLVEEDLYDKEETPSDKDDSLTESSKGKYKFKKEWIKDKGYDDIIDDTYELIPRNNVDKWKTDKEKNKKENTKSKYKIKKK